jgi:hypothetical protein
MPFSQRFIDHLLPLSDLMPLAGHSAPHAFAPNPSNSMESEMPPIDQVFRTVQLVSNQDACRGRRTRMTLTLGRAPLLRTMSDKSSATRARAALEDIDECLRWMKEGRVVRVRWKSGSTLWTRFDNETGSLVAHAENVFVGDGSLPLRGRHRADIVQDQSPVSVVLKYLVTANS